MKSSKVYSGYVRCSMCKKHIKLNSVPMHCLKCNKRQFEYGVLHRNRFVTYAKLKAHTQKGRVFIDGTHGLKITNKTFG